MKTSDAFMLQSLISSQRSTCRFGDLQSGSGNWRRGSVAQVSQADAEVMMDGVGDADGEAEAEEALGEAEGVEVVVAAEECAGDRSPEQGGGGKWEIGQVRHSEQDSGHGDGGVLAQEKAGQARHEIVVEQELLVEGPEDVSGDVLEVAFVERMQGANLFRDEDADEGEEEGGGENPEGAGQAAAAQAEVVEAGTADQDYGQGDYERDGGEDALGSFGHPENEDDETVAEEEFEKIAGGAGVGHGSVWHGGWEGSLSWLVCAWAPRFASSDGRGARLHMSRFVSTSRYADSSGVASNNAFV